MDLVREPLNDVGNLETLLPLLNLRLVLIFARKHSKWNGDIRCIPSRNHSWMGCRRNTEWRSLRGAQIHNLAAPAKSENSPLLNSLLLAQLLDDLLYAREGLGGCGLVLEESAELLLVLIGLGRIPADVRRLALEEIGHEDLVLAVLVGGSEDVGALDGLGEKAEDVVDDQDASFGSGGTSGIWISW